MIIATAAYPLDFFDDWSGYESKITRWVGEATANGAKLLVFPEYGAMELATLDGADVAGDLERSMKAVSARIPEVDALHAHLAATHGVHILAASAPVYDPVIGPRPVNRARLVAPDGGIGVQDKQIMTRFERETWDVVPGGGLQVFETALGRIGCLICYDVEFPLLGRALAEAGVEILLAPSCTEQLSGYWRVRIGAMARALEGQCVSVMSSLVGTAAWNPAVDVTTGTGGIFGPPDLGFPDTGVLGEGVLNRPGWTYAKVSRAAISEVQRDGRVLNKAHWDEQPARGEKVTIRRIT